MTLAAVDTPDGWEVKPRDQVVSPQELLPRNHGPVAFVTSPATQGKPVPKITEPWQTHLWGA